MFKKVVLSLLMIVSAASMAAAEEEGKRHARPLITTKLDRVGLSVEIPARPGWHYDIIENGEADKLIITTPENYYPITQIQKQFFPRLRVAKKDLKTAAIASFTQTRKSLGVRELISVN